MPRVSGTYSLPPSYRATAGQTIRTSQHNPVLEDIAQALTGSLPRDGSAAMSGNLPMNDRRITNLGAATAASDAVRLDQIVNEPNAGNLLVVNVDGTGIDYQDPSDFAASGDITALTETVNNAAPPGAIMHFARNTAPTGWLECNGADVSRTTYAALFSAIGIAFGSGNGTTTFGLPDMRGEFIRGWDNGRGVDSGRSFGSTQSDAYKAHTHNVNITIGTTDTSRVSGVTDGGTGSSGYSTTAQSSGGSETRPRNIALLVCIKT